MTDRMASVYWRRMKPLTSDVYPPGMASYRRTLSSRHGHPWRLRLRENWLAVRVHLDAFCLAPLRYLQAAIWRARGLRVRSRNRFAALRGRSPNAYALWIARTEPSVRDAYLSAARAANLPILPVIDCSETTAGLERTLQSIRDMGDGCRPVLVGERAEPGCGRIDHPGQLADLFEHPDQWFCVIRPGDRLATRAFEIYASAAGAAPDRSVIYADDDLIDEADKRYAPHFKPSWNPELFENHDFISGAAVFWGNQTILGALRSGQPWLRSLTRAAVQERPPLHLPLVLHHRRTRPQPICPGSSAMPSLGRPPLVTVIIPTRDQVELLKACVEGVRTTNYPSIEIIVVDNDSNDNATLAYLRALETLGIAVLKIPGSFNFSALNNAAVRHARGEVLCFLNNDVEIDDREWLSAMVSQAIIPHRGAVGARLLYPDGTIQHAGVVTGIGGGAGHAHRFQRCDDPGYFRRASLPQRVTAVTAACLVVAREKFLAVGGFDEAEFPVAFNDVDLCLKLNARGWQSFYEPGATLIHHESKSRGGDRDRIGKMRLAAELQALKSKWQTDRLRDPYHHAHLSPFSEQFVIAV